MIRGINNQPFINLDAHLNIAGFKRLHYAICAGIAMSPKVEGIAGEAADYFNGPKHHVKPLFQAINEYSSVPEYHDIRKYGRMIGENMNDNRFRAYLKLVMNAYDPYKTISLIEEDKSTWNDNAKYFPELCKWIDNLVTSKVVKSIDRVLILLAEHDTLTPMHRDLIAGLEEGYYNHRHELIHLRTRLDKPFYIWDPDSDKYILTDSHATFFNEQDWHSGGKCETHQTFSIRIDAKFTDEFRDKIGIGHISYY